MSSVSREQKERIQRRNAKALAKAKRVGQAKRQAAAAKLNGRRGTKETRRSRQQPRGGHGRRSHGRGHVKVSTLSLEEQQMQAMGLDKGTMTPEEIERFQLDFACSLSIQETLGLDGQRSEELEYEMLLQLEDVVVGMDKDMMAQLQVVEAGSKAFPVDDDTDKCVICLLEYEQGEQVCLLPCTHAYHQVCIEEWLNSQTTCPICKAELRDALDADGAANTNTNNTNGGHSHKHNNDDEDGEGNDTNSNSNHNEQPSPSHTDDTVHASTVDDDGWQTYDPSDFVLSDEDRLNAMLQFESPNSGTRFSADDFEVFVDLDYPLDVEGDYHDDEFYVGHDYEGEYAF